MRIIINRSDAIGDTLLTLPMAQIIKESHPEAHITFIISPKCVDLFKNNPFVDQLWILDSGLSSIGTFWRFFKKFKEGKYDSYFYVGGSYIPTILSFLKGIKFRGGIKSKWSSLLFLNHGLRQHRSLVTMHETDYNLNLLAPLGISYPFAKRQNFKPQLYLEASEVETANNQFKSFLKEEGKTWGELLFIHPGMTGHTLNWSSRNYGRFILQFEKKHPGKFLYLISFTSSDNKYLEGIRDELTQEEYESFRDRICFFDGAKKGLRHYMSILSKAKLYLGPSTGPTHMANALNVKIVTIYSPIKVQSALRWSPFDLSPERTQLIVPDVVCGESKVCAGASCPYFECMGKIEVEEVVDAATKLLELEQKK